MDMFTQIVGLIEFLIRAALISAVLLIVLVIVVSLLPKDNPLQRLLMAFTKRFAITVGLFGAGIPIEFIPGIDVLYDIGTVFALCWAWGSLFWEARDILSESHRSPPAALPDSRPPLYRAHVIEAETDRALLPSPREAHEP